MGVGPETGGKVFDPYGFSTMGGDKTLAFFRHAEIKHGRVAMAATVGLLFHINHIHFPGYLSPTYGVSFEQCRRLSSPPAPVPAHGARASAAVALSEDTAG